MSAQIFKYNCSYKFHLSQLKTEAIKMAHWWVKIKQTLKYPYYIIFLSNKREQITGANPLPYKIFPQNLYFFLYFHIHFMGSVATSYSLIFTSDSYVSIFPTSTAVIAFTYIIYLVIISYWYYFLEFSLLPLPLYYFNFLLLWINVLNIPYPLSYFEAPSSNIEPMC